MHQVVIGLAHGLSQLTDGTEEYLFLAHEGESDWLQPYLAGPCRVLHLPRRPEPRAGRRLVRAARSRVTANAPAVRDAWRRLPARLFRPAVPQLSDGTIEGAGVDIMHFVSQGAFLTEVPSIYQPHDLQHLHLPQFFSPRDRASREQCYRAYCEQADLVVMMTAFGRDDIARHYGIPFGRIAVVPWAPVLDAYPAATRDNLEELRRAHGLPATFAYFPAQTWPHKNHLGLVRALALLKRRYGLQVPLVCSGSKNAFFPKIRREVRNLRLEDQVIFTGFVSPLEVRGLYQLARLLVFPTKFEGFGMPLFEAFCSGLPAACSDISPLSEQAGDAALLFDPDRPEQIADAIARLWTDDALRGELAERGRARVAQFTWERTARMFRAHYRRIAGLALTEEDEELLLAPPLL